MCVLCASSSFLTAVMVSLASWVRVVAVTLACLERYWGGRGFPVTASPRTTDSPLPWGWYLCVGGVCGCGCVWVCVWVWVWVYVGCVCVCTCVSVCACVWVCGCVHTKIAKRERLLAHYSLSSIHNVVTPLLHAISSTRPSLVPCSATVQNMET